MPRVYLNEGQKLCHRLAAWVYGHMKVQHVTQRELAEKRGISQQAISAKLRNRAFDFEDFLVFVAIFQPESEELNRLVGMK